MPALLAPHTARSSRAPCARRPSAGGWSCGSTWCPTPERCPTRSGLACPQGGGQRGSPRIPPAKLHTWDDVRCLLLASGQEAEPCLHLVSPTFGQGHWPFLGPCFFPWKAGSASLWAWHRPPSLEHPLPWVTEPPGILGLALPLGSCPPQPGGGQGPLGVSSRGGDLGPVFQCSSCSQQFMQKKDLQNHLIKLHGAPKPHAVSAGPAGHWELAVARRGSEPGGLRGFCRGEDQGAPPRPHPGLAPSAP